MHSLMCAPPIPLANCACALRVMPSNCMRASCERYVPGGEASDAVVVVLGCFLCLTQWWRELRQEGGGVIGVILTLFLFAVLFLVAAFVLYGPTSELIWQPHRACHLTPSLCAPVLVCHPFTRSLQVCVPAAHSLEWPHAGLLPAHQRRRQRVLCSA